MEGVNLKERDPEDKNPESEEELEVGYEIEDQEQGPAIPETIRAQLLAAWKSEE